jgi:hypothetical protein
LSSSSPFTKADISALSSAYRDYVRQDRLSLLDGKLVVFQPVQNNKEMLMLIIVPLFLRRDIFSAYHASPSTGHMGIYKTLHRIRLRFFWPFNRKDVTNWVLRCPHCIASNGTVARNSELIFSWRLCCPFYILHVDLWAPGEIANYRGETYLMNAMCDLTGFVLVNATNNITAHDLARLLVQEVLLKAGFCGLISVNDGSTFKGLFQEVCSILNIEIHVAARGNHKAVGVEHFHRFLNKAVGIAANDRGTNTVFVEASHILPLMLGIAAPLMAPISFAVFLLSVGLSDSLSISVYLQFLLRLLTKLPTFMHFFALPVLYYPVCRTSPPSTH